MSPSSMGITSKLLETMSNIKPSEQWPTFVSFTIALLLMASYFLLRPVRDAMASDWSDTEVSFLWNIQFFVSLALVALYGKLVSLIRFKFVVPMVYGLFCASFVAFFLLNDLITDPTLIEKTFYIWVSAFSLFHVSVFWSLMSHSFSSGQAKRLFPVIAAGASAGAIIGPTLPAHFADTLGLSTLMLIAACGICAVVPMVLSLQSYTSKFNNTNKDSKVAKPTGDIKSAWWSGFKAFSNNPYLLLIGLFLLLYVFIGSFVYFEQKNLLAEYSRTERVQILSKIDWIVNTLTFFLAFFVTGRLTVKLGMTVTLVVLPVLMIIGLFIIAIAPMVIVLMGLQIARRAGNYAITRPAREMLFSKVNQDQRFKAKPVIDVVVYRGGDAASGSLFALLSEGVGLGLACIAIIGAAISAMWAAVGVVLGRMYNSNPKKGEKNNWTGAPA
ncbi:MAG: MFS transporter [Gammaproteobacteria bacterium]|nr:MFS transporter [Gammaproteobacteria bacterium]